MQLAPQPNRCAIPNLWYFFSFPDQKRQVCPVSVSAENHLCFLIPIGIFIPIIPHMDPTYTDAHHRLARYAKALSHPARVWILQFLDQVDGCIVGDLVKVLPLAQSSVSQHLKELKDAGLIQGDIDPPRVRYCINRRNWQEAQDLFGAFWRLSDPTPEVLPAKEQG